MDLNEFKREYEIQLSDEQEKETLKQQYNLIRATTQNRGLFMERQKYPDMAPDRL